MKRSILPGVIIVAIVIVGYTFYKKDRKKKEVEKFYYTYVESKVKENYRIVMQHALGTTYNMDSLKRLLFDTTHNDVQRIIILNKADSMIAKLKQ